MNLPPPEWAPHAGCWVAWPTDPQLWPDLQAAQEAFLCMCRGISEGERLQVLAQHPEHVASAQEALEGLDAHVQHVPFGDIWLRDAGPVVTRTPEGDARAVTFRWSGWGGKYHYPGDAELGRVLAERHAMTCFESPLALEGGALEHDGQGTVLTTRECALSQTRNPDWDEARVEAALAEAVGAQHVVWLDRGLLHDHTDGHIDNVARFVGPGRVVCARPSGPNDPQRDILERIERELRQSRDSQGQKLEVLTIPSPGAIAGHDGAPLPASHLNFYIGERSLVVPVYGGPEEDRALNELEQLFPGRAVRPVPSLVFLEQGGAVHCITQQIPALQASSHLEMR